MHHVSAWHPLTYVYDGIIIIIMIIISITIIIIGRRIVTHLPRAVSPNIHQHISVAVKRDN